MTTVIRRTFVIEIATSTPRRWTPYRGLTASNQRGLVVSSVYYATRHVEIPAFAEEDAQGPPSLTLIIGNADNAATNLVTEAAARRAPVTITEVKFDTDWNISSTSVWFIGKTGAPAFDGELVTIECHADVGRTGPSPSVESKTLMSSHTPPADGAKRPW